MAVIRTIGIIIMFLGIGIRIAEWPGYTAAFIVGAVLILVPRLFGWLNSARQTL